MLPTDAADFSSSPCCLMTAYTLRFYSYIFSEYCFFLGSLLLYPLQEEPLYLWFQTLDSTKYESLAFTLAYEKIFVTGNARRRICCLNIGNEELTLTILQGKPSGLGGEEGCRRAERSQLRFKIYTAFKFPYRLSALVGLSHHIFWASLYYVT